ncbi:MAG: C/D box methylation guide ribonucleoprotein complex aNOP56 subunit [Candidatus Heimdallarchaeaceae archaeon]|jgi:nucleolar protein 56
MTLKIYANIAGFFVLDENDKKIDYVKFPNNPEEIADKLHNLSANSISDELQKILSSVKEDDFETNSADVMDFIKKSGKKCSIDARSESYQNFVQKLPSILVEEKFVKSEMDYNKLVQDVSILLSKKRVTRSSQRIDKNVVHAILSMDDIDKTTNLFSARIREWYGVHFPEILKEVQSHPTLCKIITTIGSRENFTEEKIRNFGFSIEKSKNIVELAKKSMGAYFEEKDLVPVQELAQRTLDLYEERDRLDAWIERDIAIVAPNMQAIVGSAIAARMIALAGGLRELAMKPASTVQLLGAEKALFRALKTGAKPPKHGIIYQMPELHSCSWWQRGNIARAIAGRLTIAARVDAFQGKFIGNQLKAEVDKKIEEIKEKYKEPPEGKKPPIDRSFRPPPKRKGKQSPQKRRR